MKPIVKFQYAVVALLTIAALVLGVLALLNAGEESRYTFDKTAIFGFEEGQYQEVEESFEELDVVPVTFVSADGEYTCRVEYTTERWEGIGENYTFTGFIYSDSEGNWISFDHSPSAEDLSQAAKTLRLDLNSRLFGASMALFLLAISIGLVTVYYNYFTTYEKWWFILIMAAAAVVSILVPEEDCNGVNGLIIMALYLADTFFNILCELLISKQSKWNFMVSVLVEITEIAICLVLAYRFATMATTLFFWLPIDIISFVNWHRHPDRQQEELTKVRKLSGWAEVAILVGIAVWTLVVGNFLSGLDIATDLFGGNSTLENVVCYIDACASAVGICNGVFILFRIREQWVAWIACSLMEAAINILSGQWVLLVLKAGYLTNSTYGYIRWTKYIKTHTEKDKSLF